MPGDLCTAFRIISLSPLSLATDVTDATLGASGLWLGMQTGAGETATLTKSFFGCSPWLHGQKPDLCKGTCGRTGHFNLKTGPAFCVKHIMLGPTSVLVS